MSRLTAPLPKQLSRSINAGLTSNAGAVLMPKYAELLRKGRSSEHTDSSRGMTTTHRPTPQPSLANRTKPLMQSFHTSPGSAKPSTHLDAAVLPSMDLLYASTPSQIRVPILPDNYSGITLEDAPVSKPEVTIVAADPDRVVSMNPLSEVSGLGDVSFGFAQPEVQERDESHQGGMLRDVWKGIVEDVFGDAQKKSV